MGISLSSEYSDVLEDGYVAGTVTVTTSAIEAKVGGSTLEGRETLRIYNNSNNTMYFGPSGVTIATGEPLLKKQWVEINVGSNIGVFLILESGSGEARIQELA